jgi:hypothetical protein
MTAGRPSLILKVYSSLHRVVDSWCAATAIHNEHCTYHVLLPVLSTNERKRTCEISVSLLQVPLPMLRVPNQIVSHFAVHAGNWILSYLSSVHVAPGAGPFSRHRRSQSRKRFHDPCEIHRLLTGLLLIPATVHFSGEGALAGSTPNPFEPCVVVCTLDPWTLSANSLAVSKRN